MVEVEEWKDCKGWEGYYQASSLGKIRSVKRKKTIVGKRLRGNIGGY